MRWLLKNRKQAFSETGIGAAPRDTSATRMRLMPAVKTLGITYYGKETAREFDIYVNDTKLAHVLLDGSGTDTFVTKEYALPDAVKANARGLTVKFVATDGNSTASIYDVRLLR